MENTGESKRWLGREKKKWNYSYQNGTYQFCNDWGRITFSAPGEGILDRCRLVWRETKILIMLLFRTTLGTFFKKNWRENALLQLYQTVANVLNLTNCRVCQPLPDSSGHNLGAISLNCIIKYIRNSREWSQALYFPRKMLVITSRYLSTSFLSHFCGADRCFPEGGVDKQHRLSCLSLSL